MFKTVALFAIACVFPITVAVAQTQPGHTQHHSQDTQAQDTQAQGGQMQGGQTPMGGQGRCRWAVRCRAAR